MGFTQPTNSSLTSPMEPPRPGQSDGSFGFSTTTADSNSSRHLESIQSVDQGFFSFEIDGTPQDSTASLQLRFLLRSYLRLEAQMARLRRDNRKLKQRVCECVLRGYPRSTRSRVRVYVKRPSAAINASPEPPKESHKTPQPSSQVILCTPGEKPVAEEDRIAQTDSEDEGN